MENIIKKGNRKLNWFEEQVQLLMYETFSNLIGEVFSSINQVIKEKSK